MDGGKVARQRVSKRRGQEEGEKVEGQMSRGIYCNLGHSITGCFPCPPEMDPPIVYCPFGLNGSLPRVFD